MIFFKDLSEAEKALVLSAPALVTVLIGAADNEFTQSEKDRGSKAVQFRSTVGDPILKEYFQLANEVFIENVEDIYRTYGNNTDNIAEKLAEINPILKKLDTRFAAALVDNLRSLAKAIAQASGGVLGFLEISKEEAHYINLGMIEW